MAPAIWQAIMRNELRIAISFSLILAVLLTSSCTAVQIGGRNNTIEQNRQAPVSNRSEKNPPVPLTPQPTPDQQKSEDAEVQQDNAEEQLGEQREAVEEARAQLEAERQAQIAERERLNEEDARLKQERVAQQIYVLQQQQRVEQQKYVDARTRREEEEKRLAESQQRAQSPSINVESPLQPRVVMRNQATISNRVVYPYGNLNPEKNKGHSTRNKIIAGGILAGAVLLGVHLSKKKN